jgi:hypothetical protein
MSNQIKIINYKNYTIKSNTQYYNYSGKIKGYIILDEIGRDTAGHIFNNIKECKKAINDEIQSEKENEIYLNTNY